MSVRMEKRPGGESCFSKFEGWAISPRAGQFLRHLSRKSKCTIVCVMKKQLDKLKKHFLSNQNPENGPTQDPGLFETDDFDDGKKRGKKGKKSKRKQKKEKKKLEKEHPEREKREVKRPKREVSADGYLPHFVKKFLNGEEVVFHETDVYFSYFSQWVYGIIVVSNYRLIFFRLPHGRETDTGEYPIILSAPLCTMYKIEKIGGRTTHNRAYGYQIVIFMKDLRVLKFSLNTDHRTRGRLVKLLQSDTPLKFSFAYSFRHDPSKTPKHTTVYDPYKEFALRLRVVKLEPVVMNELYSKYPFYKTHKDEPPFRTWRITEVNKEWEFADTYPNIFCVPETANDDDLYNVAQSRSKSRIPILSWADCNTGLCISRSAQPTVGFNIRGNSFEDDQKYLLQIVNSSFFKKKLEIIDLRPRINAEANRFRGGGYERGYNRCSIKMMGVENIHEMRKCFMKMMEVCYSSCGSDSQFLKKITETNWYDHIRQCLRAPLFCAKLIEKEHRSCLVHCSDGWDRTSQCVCLAQMFLDPYYRTLEGFIVLIEKEWLTVGHNFQARIGTGMRNFLQEKRSPIFLQFLECVRILMVQHPTSFEFNEDLLIFIMDEIYAARFGNFLFDFQKERFKNDIYTETEDIWAYILRKNVKMKYLNPFYDRKGTKKTIVPDLRESHIVFWSNYWLRYNTPQKAYIKEITTNPSSSFHFFNSFKTPDVVVRERGFMMMKELSELAEKNHMSTSRNEKTVNIFQTEIQKMGMEIIKYQNEITRMKKILDKNGIKLDEDEDDPKDGE